MRPRFIWHGCRSWSFGFGRWLSRELAFYYWVDLGPLEVRVAAKGEQA